MKNVIKNNKLSIRPCNFENAGDASSQCKKMEILSGVLFASQTTQYCLTFHRVGAIRNAVNAAKIQVTSTYLTARV